MIGNFDMIKRIAKAFVVILFFSTLSITHPFWAARGSGSVGNSGGMIQVGQWNPSPGNPNIDNFTSFIFGIYHSNALLSTPHGAVNSEGGSNIFSLGVQTSSNVPTSPINFRKYDIVAWQRLNGSLVAAQIFSDNLDPDTFSSWNSLEVALDTVENALSLARTQAGAVINWQRGTVYTTAHAPITHNNQLWLARHNNVVSEPTIGNDWF